MDDAHIHRQIENHMPSSKSFDAVIIGAGAGGGIVAAVLAEGGLRVLVLERGRAKNFAEIPRDHLRNHRLSLYSQNLGPDDNAGNPRVFVDPQGNEHVVQPYEGGYHNNAMGVGGGTRVYGAQAWRFLPKDFRMASTYGVPAGSSLADWPISYDDVAPYYQRAEWEIGVGADSDLMAQHWPRANGYPMPAMLGNAQGAVLRAGASKLGISTLPVPLLINTVPYQHRAACIHCQHCVGFACPAEAKNGTHNTMLPRALNTGRCHIETEAMVTTIDTDGAGKVIGATYVDKNGAWHVVRAGVVVCAAGAIETARLLLHSQSSKHPHGLGNHTDQVGRHLQGHYYPGVMALMPEPIWDGIGPGPSTATVRWNHGNESAGIIGGGMLCDDFILLPITFWKRHLPPDVPRWGKANKDFMRYAYRRFIEIKGPVQDIPSPHSRVTLDPRVKDKWGMPVARLSGTTHFETVRTARFMFERAYEWMQAAGAAQIWGQPPGLHLSAGQHQAGTARMGNDPATSVVNPLGQVHGHENLYVADASVHVTNGGFNPVLTIMALAFRTAEGILR
jgi:choline dehydrogenase-like flavoprotein